MPVDLACRIASTPAGPDQPVVRWRIDRHGRSIQVRERRGGGQTADMDGAAVEPPPRTSPARWNRILGFPPDARLLIVNCDDFGMDRGVNAAVIESVEEGIASSCSLMTVCPEAPDAVRLLRRRPGIPFGVHLTLVCETPHRPWGPLSAKEKVSSLLDPAGNFFEPTPAGRAALLARARPDEVEAEFRAQIDAVVRTGLTPTHLDFHCLADGGRDDILDVTVELAAEYGLAVRVWLEPGRRAMRGVGCPSSTTTSWTASPSRPRTRRTCTVEAASRPAGRAQRMGRPSRPRRPGGAGPRPAGAPYGPRVPDVTRCPGGGGPRGRHGHRLPRSPARLGRGHGAVRVREGPSACWTWGTARSGGPVGLRVQLVRPVRQAGCVVRGNPVEFRDCPAAVSGNDRRHEHWVR